MLSEQTKCRSSFQTYPLLKFISQDPLRTKKLGCSCSLPAISKSFVIIAKNLKRDKAKFSRLSEKDIELRIRKKLSSNSIQKNSRDGSSTFIIPYHLCASKTYTNAVWESYLTPTLRHHSPLQSLCANPS